MVFILLICIGIFSTPFKLRAIELHKNLSLETNLTWVHQWLDKKRGDFKNRDRGSVVIDATLRYKPTETDELALRASFAKENGLKKVNPFILSPNADDLRDDLHNINGRARDHIQELWYARTFNLAGNSTLKVTLGIIDSTAFIDDNRFANDELTQFMNEAFVNNPLANLVSYDYGIAFEFERGPFHIRALGMQSKTEYQTDDSEIKKRFHRKDYNYYALQIGAKSETVLGEGNYRFYVFTTNKRFPNWEERKEKALKGWGISIDQDLIRERLGLLLRVGYQSDKAKVDYKSMYSLGLEAIPFCILNRKLTFGSAYGYLAAPSKNKELKHTKVFETYVSIPLYEVEEKLDSRLTFAWQYMKDRLKQSESSNLRERSGRIWGVRINVSF